MMDTQLMIQPYIIVHYENSDYNDIGIIFKRAITSVERVRDNENCIIRTIEGFTHPVSDKYADVVKQLI